MISSRIVNSLLPKKFTRNHATILHEGIKQPKKVSVYVHWPYCAKICPYCDFNKYANHKNVDHNRMKNSLLKELEYFLDMEHTDNPNIQISSLYFGGGTPSLAKTETLASIVNLLSSKNLLDVNSAEISLEANPTDAERNLFSDFRQIGINRLSLGIQALNDNDLKFLGRNHNVAESLKALELSKQIFNSVSIDLIYARHPQHTPAVWEQELKQALSLEPNHISLYLLSFEPGTSFHRRLNSNNNKIDPPSDELAAELYRLTSQITRDAGYIHYECSNYTKPGHKSRHNLHYWKGLDYIGIGPGASGRITVNGTKHAFKQALKPSDWMLQVENQGHGSMESTPLTPLQSLHEFLLCGMRKLDGITREEMFQYSGKNFEEIIDAEKLLALVPEEYLVLDSNGLRATEFGFPILDTLLLKVFTCIKS